MLFYVILNALIIWIFPVNSEYYETFASKEVRLLNDGNTIPTPAFGISDEVNDKGDLVFWAIEAGFRTIYTDMNEDIVGQVIANATSCEIVTRKKLFVIVKLPLDVTTQRKVVPALQQALKRLQLNYVDLLLIDTPNNSLRKKKIDIMEVWSGMEDAKKLGLTKSIGVMNFNREQLNLILPYCTTKPAVNKIQVNPTFTNIDLVEYCQKQGIIVLAYKPLGFAVPRPGVSNPPPPSLDDPVLMKIAKNYGVTTRQVVLRYAIDRGTIPLSRPTNKENIRLNRDILNFCLTDEEVESINKFNINRPVYPIDKIATDDTRTMPAKRRNKKLSTRKE